MAVRITHVSGYQRGKRIPDPVPAADIEHHATSRNDAATITTNKPDAIPDAVLTPAGGAVES